MRSATFVLSPEIMIVSMPLSFKRRMVVSLLAFGVSSSATKPLSSPSTIRYTMVPDSVEEALFSGFFGFREAW